VFFFLAIVRDTGPLRSSFALTGPEEEELLGRFEMFIVFHYESDLYYILMVIHLLDFVAIFFTHLDASI
jgi:hypothetical protein